MLQFVLTANNFQ